MKTIKTIIHDFKKLISSIPMPLFVMLLGLGISVAASLAVYNFYTLKSEMIKRQILFSKTHTNINFSRVLLDMEGAKFFMDKVNQYGLLNNIKEIILQANNEGDFNIMGYFSNEKKLPIIEGRDFVFDDYNKDSNNIIVSAVFSGSEKNSVKINDKVELNGKQYNVIAVTEGSHRFVYMPYIEFLRNSKSIMMSIEFKTPLKDKDFDMIEKIVESPKVHGTLHRHEIDDEEQRTVTMMYFTIIFLLQILTVINIFSFLKYWMERNKYRYSVYFLCGAGKQVFFCIVFFEMLILATVSYGVGVLLFKMVSPILRSVKLLSNMGGNAYVLIAIFYSILICFTILMLVRQVNKKFLVNMRV